MTVTWFAVIPANVLSLFLFFFQETGGVSVFPPRAKSMQLGGGHLEEGGGSPQGGITPFHFNALVKCDGGL